MNLISNPASPWKQSSLIIWSQMLCIMTYLLAMTCLVASTTVKGQVSPLGGGRGGGKPEACYDLLKKCKHDKKCRDAFAILKTVCVVKDGSCNAPMRDFSVCANIMDILSETIFDLDTKCKCHRSPVRCAAIHDRIYNNPCFANVNFLRSRNLFPTFEDQSKKHDKVTTSSPQSPSVNFLDSLMSEETTTATTITTTTTIKTTKTPTITTTPDIEAEGPRAHVINDVIEPRRLKNDDITSNEGQPKYSSAHDDGVLLHVVAIATGVLVFLTLAVGTSLVVYFGLRRRPSEEKQQISMT